jgi:predicted RNA methylase
LKKLDEFARKLAALEAKIEDQQKTMATVAMNPPANSVALNPVSKI